MYTSENNPLYATFSLRVFYVTAGLELSMTFGNKGKENYPQYRNNYSYSGFLNFLNATSAEFKKRNAEQKN